MGWIWEHLQDEPGHVLWDEPEVLWDEPQWVCGMNPGGFVTVAILWDEPGQIYRMSLGGFVG